MTELIQALRREHNNIARLLDVLERELAAFDNALEPDYELVEAIAEYFVGFPDRCHHPREDLILDRMREYDPAWSRATVDLEAEHRNLSQRAHAFLEAVRNVINEAEVPRSAFHNRVVAFIDQQRQHMDFEEKVFFPAAIETLGAEDWTQIDHRTGEVSDSLFGDAVSSQFEDLRQRVLDWDAERRATTHDPNVSTP